MPMMLRANASNGVKACNDWGIKHFGCLAHSLHLVVAPFLLGKSKSKKEVDHTADQIVDKHEEDPEPKCQ